MHYNKFLAALLCCGFIITTPCVASKHHTKEGESSMIFSHVVNPSIPSSVTFAGKSVNLDRFDLYESLDRELTSMAYTHGNTLLTIKRANRYFPRLIPILKDNGVPTDLIYLACIESYLNPRAYSPAKAAGMWQFIPSTGKEYGLEIDDYVDERYHPEKATQAACLYLKNALSKYGNWESVAASYNAGMARITKELEAQKAKSAYDLYLNDETSRYIFRLLAMKIIMENPKAFGYRIYSDQLYSPIRTKVVEVSTPVDDWATWATEHGITYLTLREFNPWIRAKSLPNKTGKTYQVEIPLANDMLRSKCAHHVYNSNWVVE